MDSIKLRLARLTRRAVTALARRGDADVYLEAAGVNVDALRASKRLAVEVRARRWSALGQ